MVLAPCDWVNDWLTLRFWWLVRLSHTYTAYTYTKPTPTGTVSWRLPPFLVTECGMFVQRCQCGDPVLQTRLSYTSLSPLPRLLGLKQLLLRSKMFAGVVTRRYQGRQSTVVWSQLWNPIFQADFLMNRMEELLYPRYCITETFDPKIESLKTVVLSDIRLNTVGRCINSMTQIREEVKFN